MGAAEMALLFGGGLVAGVVNTLAGGGSLLTVPLLVLVGIPGNLANGTNRIGVLLQCVTAARQFRTEGVPGFRNALPVLLPTVIGSLIGAYAISLTADKTFERLFGAVMVLLLIPLLLRPMPGTVAATVPTHSPAARFLIFLAIGLYGGSFQAGVGIALIFALSYAGYDLVRSNSIKVVIILALTAAAIPVFVAQRQIAWLPGLTLGAGFALGGAAGAKLAVRGGEAIIRPVLAVSVLALAGRMLGLY